MDDASSTSGAVTLSSSGGTASRRRGKARSTRKTLKTFAYFQKLPPEIRVKIWGFASHFPRNVNIRTVSSPVSWISRFVSSSPPPSIMHTNQESRIEGLKHYKLMFGSSIKLPFANVTVHPTIYLNFASDTIMLPRVQSLTDVIMKDGKDLRSLAFNIWDLLNMYYRVRFTLSDILKPLAMGEFDRLDGFGLDEIILYAWCPKEDALISGKIDFVDIIGKPEDASPNTKRLRFCAQLFNDHFDHREMEYKKHVEKLRGEGKVLSGSEAVYHRPVVRIARMLVDKKKRF